MVEALNTQSTEGYIIRHISVSCPECACGFNTRSLVELPPVTEYDTIEADLHRVLPDAELRSALIAVCPHCNYATWTVRFRASSLNPEMLPDAAEMPHSKKFALAVKWARDKEVSPLDIAFIALNGLYCAREAGEDSDLWLELAAYEQSRGIAEESLIPASGQDYLIMAELWRQLGSFDNAVAAYDKAAEDDFIPRDLIEQQKRQCAAGSISPTVLPPYMVREIYPAAPEFTDKVPVGKNGRPVPPIIERRPKPDKLEMANFGPPERRTPLSSAVPDEPIPAGITAEDDNAPIELSVDSAVPAMRAEPQSAQAPAQQLQRQEEIPMAKVRQIIAQPSGASAIYLVQAAQIPQVGGNEQAAKGGRNGKGSKKRASQPQADPLPKIEMPANEYFAGASSPSEGAEPKEPKLTPMQRALNKAMRKEPQGDRFPDIQLTDEEEEAYAHQYEDYGAAEEEEEQQAAQPAASSNDFNSAIAQVESFLNLRRQPSYQNWIRSYKQ